MVRGESSWAEAKRGGGREQASWAARRGKGRGDRGSEWAVLAGPRQGEGKGMEPKRKEKKECFPNMTKDFKVYSNGYLK